VSGTPTYVYARCRANAEFRQLFADRVQLHLFNGGALSVSNNLARWNARTDEIDRAIVAESARWGDYQRPGQPYKREVEWLASNAWERAVYFPSNHFIALKRFRDANLFPSVNAPILSQHGGAVPVPYSLSITNPNATGAIYYTVDGRDPRLVGGGLASWALPYTEPLTLTNHTLVRARVRSSTSTIWSAVVEAEFFTPQDFAALQLNEIHYNPPMFGGVDGERFEFLELRNTGPATLDLSGLEFAAGVNFVFTNGARLAPGAFCVLVNSASNFATLFTNTPIHGVFGGKLDNGGETLTLTHPLGFTVFSVAYDDVPPWPTAADGTGFSLQRTNTRTNANDPANWTAAVPTPGSPAAPELIDTDADGLPDIWEQVHGTDLNVPDANEDPDHDGMTNLQEFLAGTDPNDPSSGLRITGAALDPTATAIVLTFEAVSDRTYTVQWRTNANAGAWQSLQNIPAAATRQTVRVTNALTADEAGFYRLVTPAIP
jgi:hypothetical protein